MLRAVLHTILLVALGSSVLRSQQLPSFASVEIGGIGMLLGDASVPLALPNIATPPVSAFEAPAARFRLGGVLGVNVPMNTWLGVGMRATAYGIGGELTAEERLPINQNDAVYVATVEHRRVMSGNRVDVAGYLRVHPWHRLELDVALGVPVATTFDLVQTQRFTDPVGITFSDGVLEQTTGSGTIPHRTSLVAEVRAAWPVGLTRRFDLIPAIGFRSDASSVLDGATWATRQVYGGVGIRMHLGAREQPVVESPVRRADTVIIRDTMTVVEQRSDTAVTLFSRLEALDSSGTTPRVLFTEIYQRMVPRPAAFMEVSLAVDVVYPDGASRTAATVQPERVARVRSMPLYPILVFDEGGTDIPERYLRAGLHVQHNVLRVMADSLRAKGTRRVDVVGYHDGTQAGAARAHLRAEAVATALRGLGVQRSAMSVRNTVAPSLTFDGTVELRITPQVALRGYIRETKLVATLPELRVRPEVVSDEEITSWRCSIRQAGRQVYSVSQAAPVPVDVRWPMGEMSMEPGESIEYAATFGVTNARGEARESDAATVTVQAVSDASGSMPKRTIEEFVVVGVQANEPPVRTAAPCVFEEVFAGCTAREIAVYAAIAGDTSPCRIVQNEERKP